MAGAAIRVTDASPVFCFDGWVSTREWHGTGPADGRRDTAPQSGLRHVTRAQLIGVIGLLWNATLLAQLSPGDLARPHADLEGLNNCTSCHEAGKQVQPSLCLDCHTLLKSRIDAGDGLHARPDYRNCVTCHSDHHGRDFELIFWENGRDNFDHDQTGYTLEGAHATVECRTCHTPANIPDPEPLRAAKKDLERTFLGLDPSCLSCHRDEHRAQLGDDCLKCHGFDTWKPAPEFDHSRARFRLTGRHVDVDCAKCHPSERDNRFDGDPTFNRYVGIDFAQCSACHSDPHQGRLGANCSGCHATTGWSAIAATSNFDHGRTRFPLRGRHADLQCESCHKPGRPFRGMAFQRCMDCHSDFHAGQFAARPDGPDCENCHTESGFSPATFTVEQHQRGDFPLEGAHLAIPCMACHAGSPPGTRAGRSMIQVNRFTFAATTCATCHGNPHGEGLPAPVAGRDECLTCHTSESWRELEFDHAATRFPLEGRHETTDCVSCHPRGDGAAGQVPIDFKAASLECQACHTDIHRGQFITGRRIGAEVVAANDCSRCHTPATRWEATRFEHNRDARFALEGAHAEVPCASCHRTETLADDISVVRYKPMETSCVSCHGGP